ncbi:FAD-binding domain-containing protein [Coniophora puteana RWD-64-598 SS2]|uniref:FAD-binding domain-containing protein n=1 Tax=Coniophora puteana (strain RWD-64-598) TaxID=741705 RepID=R7SEZ3_CONPW|nr:FAD-binding domain-containing protein [Coniophora puteana RWD-64-598 SS2]EIW74307.1 FAD-binding domain-containing protein [Coniophora puteana RWD-64-598 SS2]
MKLSLSTLAAGIFYVASVDAASASQCRCVYGQSCWPSGSDFSQLQSLLSQSLLYPKPTASQCYSTSGASDDCSDVIANYTSGIWRSDMVGSMEAPNWESYIFQNGTIAACYPETNITGACDQGNVPVIAVDARTPADIQAAVNFSVMHDLRMVVKNTGHDYIGRSAGRGALMVWTHNMKNITHDGSFVPEGAPPNETYDAFTLEAGVQWFEAYAAANATGRVLVGGLSAGGSVGAAGGWIQGGGHSALSSNYGLGVDNAVEMTVVTSTGQYLTVNAHQNPDLFWALRGGGGGTYGVVTSVTYKTHPALPALVAIFSVNSTNSSLIQQLFTESYTMLPSLSDAGWGGYGGIDNTSVEFIYLSPNVSWAQANETWTPFFERAANLTSAGLNITAAETLQFPSFYTLYESFFGTPTGQNGGNVILGSRLIPREVIENNNDEMCTAIFETPGMSWNFVAGGKVSTVDPDSAGLNPAWRKAVVHITWGASWEDGASAEDIGQLAAGVKEQEARIRELTPESGCYFNEASPFEEDFRYTFFGDHYAKLKEIKDKYDPHQLFVVTQGVGSEEWDDELTCRV